MKTRAKEKVNYDITGKVTHVFSNTAKTNLTTGYIYDDRGFRLAKELYNTGVGRRVKLTENVLEWETNVASK
jgi:hypothetical protein